MQREKFGVRVKTRRSGENGWLQAGPGPLKIGIQLQGMLMARRPRLCPPGFPVHVVHRGNNRRFIFAAETDRQAYANWLREGGEKFAVDIHAWVFMTNHVHLLVTPRAPESVSRCMQFLGRYYVRYFNRRYRRSGTLFEGRFRSSIVEDGRYFLACQRYIELNSVRAGMAADPADYPWSSYAAHGLGRQPRMWTPHAEYLALGETPATRRAIYRRLVADGLSEAAVENVRKALNTGLAFGSDRFKRKIAALTGVRQHHRKSGPRRAGPA